MAELSNNETSWAAKVDNIKDLMRHPGWTSYEELVIQPSIDTLSYVLLEEGGDESFLVACRYLRRALIALRKEPERLAQMAQQLRDDVYNTGRYVEDTNAQS